jgi:hypothetical protein
MLLIYPFSRSISVRTAFYVIANCSLFVSFIGKAFGQAMIFDWLPTVVDSILMIKTESR